MKWSDVVTVAGTGLIVSVDDMKAHMRVSHVEDDTYIETLIKVAREEIEIYTTNSLLAETRTLTLDDFPRGVEGAIEIPRLPVTNIDSVKYIDSTGALVTYSAANYQADLQSRPARIVRGKDVNDWPTTDDGVISRVQVQYDCGYTVIPEGIILAAKLLVSEMYWNRRDKASVTEITAAERLCYTYRLWT